MTIPQLSRQVREQRTEVIVLLNVVFLWRLVRGADHLHQLFPMVHLQLVWQHTSVSGVHSKQEIL